MSSHDTSLTRIDALPRLLGGNYAKLIAPVSICMLVVVWSVGALTDPMEAIRSDRWIESGNRGNSTMADSNSSAVVDSESKADSLSLGAAIVSALIAVATLTVLTLIMLLLYKYHCTFILIGWLAFSCFFLFTTMMYTWLHEVLLLFRVPHDWITISILLWNISVVGAVSLFCYAHPTVRQGYNLLAAILTSWSMTSYPSVLVWSILLAIATYDIIAVMCPFGPLRLLIELAQRRQEVIPGFIYDSGSETSPRLATDDGDPHTSVGTAGNPPTPVPLIDRISQPYKLGLGDFIFYCLLVGKAQSYGGVPWTFCFITILAGMIATLFSLFFFRDVIHALPALPLSIYAAMATLFCAQYAVAPLAAFSSAFVLPL